MVAPEIPILSLVPKKSKPEQKHWHPNLGASLLADEGENIYFYWSLGLGFTRASKQGGGDCGAFGADDWYWKPELFCCKGGVHRWGCHCCGPKNALMNSIIYIYIQTHRHTHRYICMYIQFMQSHSSVFCEYDELKEVSNKIKNEWIESLSPSCRYLSCWELVQFHGARGSAADLNQMTLWLPEQSLEFWLALEEWL